MLAECRRPDVDPKWFFPERGESHRPGKNICSTCPVELECAEYRERTNSEYGMWAGQMTKRRRNANVSAPSATVEAPEPSAPPAPIPDTPRPHRTAAPD